MENEFIEVRKTLLFEQTTDGVHMLGHKVFYENGEAAWNIDIDYPDKESFWLYRGTLHPVLGGDLFIHPEIFIDRSPAHIDSTKERVLRTTAEMWDALL